MSGVDVYLRGTPWFLPTIGMTAILILVGLLRARRRHWLAEWLVTMSFVAFLAATVTPSGSRFPWDSHWSVNWSFHIPSVSQVLSANYDTINVWIAVPMGFSTSWWILRRYPWQWLLLPYAVALGVEVVQMAVRPLGRSAFLFGDVVNAWVGVTLGLALGWLLRVALTRSMETDSEAQAR